MGKNPENGYWYNSSNEGRNPVGHSIPREMVGKFVSYISFGVGILWIILDKENQGWHDKIAGTYVVRCDKIKATFFLNLKIKEENMDISKKVQEQMENSSWIRRMFEQGIELKNTHGENVFDLSLGNPIVNPPKNFLRY